MLLPRACPTRRGAPVARQRCRILPPNTGQGSTQTATQTVSRLHNLNNRWSCAVTFFASTYQVPRR